MFITVVKDTVPIPHPINHKGKIYQLNPGADVPEDLGRALVKGNAKVFAETKTLVTDKRGYKVRGAAGVPAIMDIFGKLSKNAQAELMEHAQALADGGTWPAPAETTAEGAGKDHKVKEPGE